MTNQVIDAHSQLLNRYKEGTLLVLIIQYNSFYVEGTMEEVGAACKITLPKTPAPDSTGNIKSKQDFTLTF